MKRKEFLQVSIPAMLLLVKGRVVETGDYLLRQHERSDVVMRFAVASDGHYGQRGTDYEEYFNTFVATLNNEHVMRPVSFCVINGDIVHDEISFMPAAKKALDKLAMPYFVTQGNHDHADAAEWENIWRMPVNHDVSFGNQSCLLATSSDASGKYLCPDVDWVRGKLAQYERQQNVFLFVHINPAKLTRHGVHCPELLELLGRYRNVRVVFNGHDHDEEGLKTKSGVPFVFDAHFGGNWGTSYRGYRIVEVMKENSILTYMMDPQNKLSETVLPKTA